MSKKPNARSRTWLKVLGLVLAYCVVFAFLDLMRHYSYTQNSNDVAVFDQSLWWLLHGRGLYNSLEQMNHLGVHASPIFLLLVPFYALFPSPVTLIVCQVAACAAGIVAVFLIAGHVLGDRAGLVFAALFSLYHPLHGVTWDLLNELAYVIAPLLFAFYGLMRRRFGVMWTCVVLGLLCKEEIGFVAAFLGICAVILAVKESEKPLAAHGAALFFAGMAWSFFALDLLIPHFRGGPYRYFTVENRYAAFGGSMGGVLAGIATHPLTVLRTVFTRPKIFYCIELVAPTAFLPLLAPLLLLPALPSLAANMLSSASMMSMVGARYPAAIIPFVFIAAIYGTKYLVDRSKNPSATLRRIQNTQLAFTILCTLFFSSTPLRIPFRVPRVTAHCAAVRRLLAEIPPGSVVATQPNFTAHVPHGCEVSPFYRPDAGYVLLDPAFAQWYRDAGMTPREILKKGYRLKDTAGTASLFVRSRRFGCRGTKGSASDGEN